MTTLEQQVTDLARRLQYASEDDALAIALAVEAASLVAAADAQRTRPANLPSYLRVQTPEQVAAVRGRTLEAELALVDRLVAASVSTAELGARLGLSSAAVTKRRQAGRLMAFQHRGDWRYPLLQLEGSRVRPDVLQVWQALPTDRQDLLNLVRWFDLPSAHLGATPREVLDRGDLEQALDAATYVGGR